MANVPVKKQENLPASEGRKSADTPALNEYYRAVSGKFRAAKFITMLCLIVFLIFSFTFLRGEITLENLRYLLKFISFTNTETSITASKINYPSGDPNRLELYMGDLCTLSPSGYGLYDFRGNQIMSAPITYAAPVLEISDRYVLCYDMDGQTFSVLNSFAKLYDGTSDYPITAGAVSNKGGFAIAAASREYRTAITVYGDNLKPATKIYKNGHLMDMEFSADSTTLAVMTAGVLNGQFYTKIELVSATSDEILDSAEIGGLGYTFYFTADGYIAVTDEGIVFFDSDLNPTNRINHDAPLSVTDCSEKYITCIYSDGIIGNNSLVRIYSSAGKLAYEGSFTDKLIGVDSADDGDYVFILTGDVLTRINLENKKIGYINVTENAIDVLAASSTSVLVALKNYALTYDLTDFKEQYYANSTADTQPPETAADTTSADTTTDDTAAEDTTPSDTASADTAEGTETEA